MRTHARRPEVHRLRFSDVESGQVSIHHSRMPMDNREFEKVNSSCQAVLAHGYYSAGIDFSGRAAVYEIDERFRYKPPGLVEECGWFGNWRRAVGLLATRASLDRWDWSGLARRRQFGMAGEPTSGDK